MYNVLNKPFLSIIIVSYNVKEEILNCIQSIQNKIDARRMPYEVMVSDNGSTDGSVTTIKERFPWVKFIENNANLGFSKANNVAAGQAKGEVLFFLNPDTLIVKGIEEMTEYIREHKEVGIMGPVVYNKNNAIDHTTSMHIYTPFSLFLYYFFYSYYRRKQLYNLATGLKSQFPFDADWVIGASMLVRRGLFNSIKGFDERFFWGMEDEDICMTVRRKGYSVKVFPLAKIVHLRNRAIIKNPFALSLILDNQGEATLYFYKKHYPFSIPFVYLTVIAFYLLRLPVCFVKKIYSRLLNDKIVLKQREEIIHSSWLSLRSFLRFRSIKYLVSGKIGKNKE